MASTNPDIILLLGMILGAMIGAPLGFLTASILIIGRKSDNESTNKR